MVASAEPLLELPGEIALHGVVLRVAGELTRIGDADRGPWIDAQIEAGNFAALLSWLRKNVHRHGRKFTPNELLERANAE